MNIRINGIVNDSIVDGPGLRLAVFFQGCPYDCPGCHNPQTHDPSGGSDRDSAAIIALMDGNPLLDGLTLSGGEPFLQPEGALVLARAAKERGLNVWAYSGSTYEQLILDAACRKVLDYVDVLVDGPFVLAQRSLALPFRGSGNQRLIDVQKSREAAEPRLWQPPAW